MFPTQDDLVELARAIPSAALPTAYTVLKAVKDTQDSFDGAKPRDLGPSGSNVIRFRARRTRHRPAPASPETMPAGVVLNLGHAAEPPPLKQRIVKAERRIAVLEAHIEHARARGEPTRLAESLLMTFRQSLALMRCHLRSCATLSNSDRSV